MGHPAGVWYWRIGWCVPTPPPHLEVLWVKDCMRIFFQYTRKEQIGRGSLLPRLRFRPQWKGCDLVYWMVERFAVAPQSEKQPLWFPQNSLGTWGVAKISWGVAQESAADICCRFAFWGAGETCWGVSTLEIGCPLHAGCYLPQDQGEGKHVEPGRKDPSSCSTLYWQSFTFVTWQKKRCSQGSASAAQSQAVKVGTELKGNSLITGLVNIITYWKPGFSDSNTEILSNITQDFSDLQFSHL